MTLYWLYDLPSWLFAAIVIALFVGFGLAGLRLTRGWVRRIHGVDHSHNDIVGYFLAALTVFYGITLGLVAAGTWSTFSAANDKVDAEAQLVSSLYRDAGSYQNPWKSELRTDLTAYLKSVVQVSWPLQRKGIVPIQSGVYLDAFQNHLMSFEPKGRNDEVLQAEGCCQSNANRSPHDARRPLLASA